MNKNISVIIVTYNSEKHIYDCLDSIFKYNDIGDALEVIIVDNQSKNFSKTKKCLLEKYSGNLVIVENERNGGYGQGNNVGIKVAKAPIIMIMNPDVRLVEPLFKVVTEAFESPRVIQYGVKSLDKDGKISSSMGVVTHINPIVSIPLFSICNRNGWFLQKYMYLIGACFFVRKSSFEEIGLFDERIFMYGEEDDIHYRLLQKHKDGIILYNHNLSYIHLHGLYSSPKKWDDFSEDRLVLSGTLRRLSERGLSRKKVLMHELTFARIKLFSAKMKYLFRKNSGTRDYIQHKQLWIKELQSQICQLNNL